MAKKYNNIFNLEDKTALIIGGSGYLGFEMSKALFLMGAKVIIANRDIKNFNYNFKKFKPNLDTRNQFKFIKLDITKSKSFNKFYKNLNKECNSKLDILVNCAWNGKKNPTLGGPNRRFFAVFPFVVGVSGFLLPMQLNHALRRRSYRT